LAKRTAAQIASDRSITFGEVLLSTASGLFPPPDGLCESRVALMTEGYALFATINIPFGR